MFIRTLNCINKYITKYINKYRKSDDIKNEVKNEVYNTFRTGVVYVRVGQLAFHYIITFLFFPKLALMKIFQVLNLESQTIEGLEYYERECVYQVHRVLKEDKSSFPPTIMIFNHPNGIDPLLLFYHFFPYPRFVTSTVHIPWILRLHAWKMKSIMMTPFEKTNRGEWIYQQLEKKTEHEGWSGLMTIAPTAGREYPDIQYAKQHVLPPFRRGAFLKKYPILPVLIQYDPFSSSNTSNTTNTCMHFLKGENTIGFVWRLVSRYPYTPIRYSIRVLPKIVAQEGEEIESFMGRVKHQMEKEMENIK